MNGTIRYTIRPYDTIWMLAQVFNTTVDSIMELNPGIDPRNLLVNQVITIRPGYQRFPSSPQEMDDMDDMADMTMEDLIEYFRMLWEQHITWTRITALSIVHNLPETELVTQRLLRNATDFGNAMATFYGEEVAQQFANLFTEHITIAAELVQAAVAGNNEAYAEVQQRWYDNAEQIATFLASINPFWSEDDWGAMMFEHLDLLAANIANMVAGNYAESISGYDEVEMQALEMADMMAEGIAEQFPG